MTANVRPPAFVDELPAMLRRDLLADPECPDVVAAARAGSPAAMSAIYLAYRSRVARHLQRLINDPTAIDDLVQEVFIAAFAGLRGFRGDARVSSWLHVITVNVARRRWKTLRRRRHIEHPLDDRIQAARTHLADADLDVQQRLCLLRELECLPEPLREAFIARAVDGLDLREAAVALNVSVSTVSWRARRAQRVLCERLGLPLAEP